jgi:hypothetical protein
VAVETGEEEDMGVMILAVTVICRERAVQELAGFHGGRPWLPPHASIRRAFHAIWPLIRNPRIVTLSA